MAAPAIGRQARWTPSEHAKVDWSHPLAQGLFACHLALSGTDLARGYNLPHYGTPDGFRSGSFGRGLYRSGPTGREIAISTTHPLCIQPPLTLVWAGDFVANGGGNRFAYGSAANHTNTSPFLCAALMHDSTRWVLMANSSGSFNQLNGTSAPVVGRNVIAGVITSGGRSIWVNGTRENSTTGFTTITYNSNAIFGFTDYSGSAANTVNAIGLAYTRELSANEIGALTADPFCMLRL